MSSKLISRYLKPYLLFPCLILLFCFPLSAQATEGNYLFTSGIYVTLPPGQEAEAEDVATYIFRVENRTSEPVTLRARAVSAQDWPLLSPTEEFHLEPGGEEYLVCSLLIPSTVTAGTEDHLYLYLSGKNTEKDYIVKTTVKAVRHLKWEPLPLFRAKAGEEIFIPVRLLNLGTTTEKIDLNISSEKGWPVYWHNANLNTIFPGQEGEVILSCLVPPTTPAGTLEEIALRLLEEGPEETTLKLKILVTEAQKAEDDLDLVIPLSSSVNFSYLPPGQKANLPWSLTWRTRGDLVADTHFDLLVSGTHDSLPPTASYLGVTGEKWALRLGALGHNWDGVIPPPTYSAALYFQDQKSLPWSIWVGPSTAEVAPLWWGTKIDLNRPDLRLNYMQNLEQDRYFEHALSGTYQLYASPLYGWKLTANGALGLGETNPLTQGGFTLTRREENWELLGGFEKGTDFYTLTAFDEVGLTSYVYTEKDLRLASGFTWRLEAPPETTALRSNKIWSELATGDYRFGLAHTHRSDGRINEIKGGITRRQPQSTLSFSANYSHEDLQVLRQSLLLSGRYRHRLSSENYLEALFNETLTFEQEEMASLPELGIRWRYASARSPWNCFGLLQWDLSVPFSKITSFQTGVGSKMATGTAWQIYAQLFFQERDPVYSIIFSLQHHDLFYIPTPWSGIHGKAFVDLDRNGMYSRGEPGLSGLPIVLNGNKATLTTEDGNWEIPFTGSGRQVLEFPTQFQGYFTLDSRKELTTEPQKSISLLVPYLPPTEVYGRVFADANLNNELESNEKGLSAVTIAVFDHNNDLIIEKSTERDGAFFLTLLPGEYRLEIEHSLTDNYEIPQAFSFKVTTDSPFHLSIPVTPVTKEIEFFNEDILAPEFWESYTEDNW